MSFNDRDPFASTSVDKDPQETQEWLDSLSALADHAGRGRAREIMQSLLRRSHELQLNVPLVPTTDYINTIAPEDEPAFPGDEQIERTYRAWFTAPSDQALLSVDTSPLSPLRPHFTKLASITFSRATTTRLVLTRSLFRDTHLLDHTLVRS